MGFTVRGSCLLAAGGTAVVCGLALGEIDLVRAGLLALVLPVAAALVVHVSQVRITNRRRLEPTTVVAGGAVTVHLTIANAAPLPTGPLMLEDQLPDLAGDAGGARFVLDSLGPRESRNVSYRVPGLGRGRYRVGPLRVRHVDPFRLVDVKRSFRSTAEFLVAPVVDRLTAAGLPRADDVGDGVGSHLIGIHGADDASTREYRIGDDLRKVHWRSSARTGALMVRQEERAWQGRTTLLLDLRAGAHAGASDVTGDLRADQSLEWAVSAAASIGTHVLLAGRRLALADDPTAPTSAPVPTPEALTGHLAAVDPLPGRGLGRLTDLARHAARDSAVIAVLGRLDADELGRLATARPWGGGSAALALLLDVDSWSGARDDGSPAVEAHAAVLRAAGWRVAVVRRGDPTARAWSMLSADPRPAGVRP